VESLGAPFYRDSIHGRRRLTLADGFYELCVEGEGRTAKKQPFLIKRQDGKLFAFAGMWEKVQVKGEILDAATTLTRRAVAAEVHDRMPMVYRAMPGRRGSIPRRAIESCSSRMLTRSSSCRLARHCSTSRDRRASLRSGFSVAVGRA
jgi:hypothetical protein